MGKKAIWITWENQVRNQSMARLVGAKLYVINKKANRLSRYAYCVLVSTLIILKEKPDVLIVQNPSIVLNYLALILRPIFRFLWVSDAHFVGVTVLGKGRLMQRLLDHCNRRADLVIVTNKNHAHHVQEIGGVPFICQDPLPELPEDVPEIPADMDRSVFYICSFDIDEPYREFLSAAVILQEKGYKFFVSGNYKKVGLDAGDHPQVRFLGYVPYGLYSAYLKASSIVVDLTMHEDCLLCGAYEAMAAEIPLVTSEMEALRSYFTHGTVYTNQQPENIAAAIEFAYEGRERLRKEIRVWKAQAVPEIEMKIEELREMILLKA